MKDIQHYKDLIAVEHGYEDWDDVLIDYKTGEIDRNTAKELENEWAKRYAEDLCKAQLEICRRISLKRKWKRFSVRAFKTSHT